MEMYYNIIFVLTNSSPDRPGIVESVNVIKSPSQTCKKKVLFNDVSVLLAVLAV